MTEITLPANGWRPRTYQRKAWDYFKRGGKRAIVVAHRRWGKDDIALHLACRAAHIQIATYWHMLPEYEQARKAIWDAVNPHTGLRRIDEAFPRELRQNTNEQSMFIRFKTGSTWQVIGSDNFKSLVGTPPAGIVFSEWAKAHPGAWAYLAPILLENGGWALFITTPEGRNHAHSMFEMAKDDGNWFAEVQTVEDSGAIPVESVEQQRKEYHSLYGDEAGDALIEQEYYCSFSAAILGAYWGKELSRAEREGRITDVGITEGLPVHTAWDIGVDDPMAIWCFQIFPGRINVVDYYESSGQGFDHYTAWLQERGYSGTDWVPHDAKVRDPSAPGARTRLESLVALRRHPKLVPNQDLMDGINAARKTLPLAWFDKTKCAKGLECLRSYKAEWDDKARTFKKTPKHDWACFAGDTKVLTRHGTYQIKDLPNQGEVLTPCGWRTYRNLGITRRNARLVEVTFDDGLTVRCTPDHLFLTANGWKSASDLLPGLLIQSSLIRSRNTLMVASIVCGQRKIISRGEAQDYTGRFGWRLLAKSLRAVMSTIGTVIRQTICSAISNVCLQKNICRLRGLILMASVLSISQMQYAPRPLSGIDRRRGEYGIAATWRGLRPGRNGGEKIAHATIVSRLFQWLSVRVGIHNGSARTTVRPLRIASVAPISKCEDVYDLEVPGISCFSLVNGAVVHNSHGADAWRYLSLAWAQPIIKTEEKPKPMRGVEKITVDELLRLTRPQRMRV